MYVVVLFVLSVHSFCCLERIYIQTSALKELLFVRLFEFSNSTKVDNAREKTPEFTSSRTAQTPTTYQRRRRQYHRLQIMSSKTTDSKTGGGRGEQASLETRVIKFVFTLVMMKAANDVFERQHGISPIHGFLKGLNETRKKLARAIMPSSNSGSGGGNRNKKKFKGKGNKLGKK